MVKYLKWLFLSLSIGSLLVGITLILSSKDEVKQAIKLAAMQTGTVITDPDIKEYDGEQLKWRIRAEKAHDESNQLTLTKPRIDLYTKQGALVPITASNGSYDKNEKKVYLDGDVRLKYEDWNLASDALEFHQSEDQIHATKPFTLYQKGVKITGSRMSIYKKSEKITIHDVVMQMDE